MTGPAFGDFAAGTVYQVGEDDAAVGLTLDKAQRLADSGREGGSFRLEFLGPADPILPQATYRLASGDAAHDIFIVPIAREVGGMRYEAVFY